MLCHLIHGESKHERSLRSEHTSVGVDIVNQIKLGYAILIDSI